MSHSWEEMHENVEDRQPSGGKLHRRMESPFYRTVMEIRNEAGTVIGGILINELIPLTPTEMKDRSFLVGIYESEVPVVPKSRVKLKFEEQGPFPDED